MSKSRPLFWQPAMGLIRPHTMNPHVLRSDDGQPRTGRGAHGLESVSSCLMGEKRHRKTGRIARLFDAKTSTNNGGAAIIPRSGKLMGKADLTMRRFEVYDFKRQDYASIASRVIRAFAERSPQLKHHHVSGSLVALEATNKEFFTQLFFHLSKSVGPDVRHGYFKDPVTYQSSHSYFPTIKKVRGLTWELVGDERRPQGLVYRGDDPVAKLFGVANHCIIAFEQAVDEIQDLRGAITDSTRMISAFRSLGFEVRDFGERFQREIPNGEVQIFEPGALELGETSLSISNANWPDEASPEPFVFSDQDQQIADLYERSCEFFDAKVAEIPSRHCGDWIAVYDNQILALHPELEVVEGVIQKKGVDPAGVLLTTVPPRPVETGH